jgi:hypothetical protein
MICFMKLKYKIKQIIDIQLKTIKFATIIFVKYQVVLKLYEI